MRATKWMKYRILIHAHRLCPWMPLGDQVEGLPSVIRSARHCWHLHRLGEGLGRFRLGVGPPSLRVILYKMIRAKYFSGPFSSVDPSHGAAQTATTTARALDNSAMERIVVFRRDAEAYCHWQLSLAEVGEFELGGPCQSFFHAGWPVFECSQPTATTTTGSQRRRWRKPTPTML